MIVRTCGLGSLEPAVKAVLADACRLRFTVLRVLCSRGAGVC